MSTPVYSDQDLEKIKNDISKYCNIKSKEDALNLNILFNIDWFIWEDPNTAHIYTEVDVIPIPDKLWNTIIFNTNEMITIILPTSKSEQSKFRLKMFGPLTLKKVIKNIYDFYKLEIHEDEFDEIDNDGYYFKIAYEKFYRGEKVTYLDFLGTTKISNNGHERRCPFSCSGLVRFEGFEEIGHNVYKIILGT